MSARKPERKVKDSIKSWLNANGFYHFSPIGGAFTVHGVPDIVVCARGRFVGIECKAPGKEGNVTPNQQDHLDRIKAAGGVSLVASSLDEVVQAFVAYGIVVL